MDDRQRVSREQAGPSRSREATVLARFADEVLVDVGGRGQLVANPVLRGVRAGDRVVIRRGAVIGRCGAAEQRRPGSSSRPAARAGTR